MPIAATAVLKLQGMKRSAEAEKVDSDHGIHDAWDRQRSRVRVLQLSGVQMDSAAMSICAEL